MDSVIKRFVFSKNIVDFQPADAFYIVQNDI